MNGDIVTVLVVGLVAGWLAGKIQKGKGFGIAGDLVVGVLGAVFGSWLFGRLDISLGGGLAGLIIEAVVGALVILFVLRSVAKR